MTTEELVSIVSALLAQNDFDGAVREIQAAQAAASPAPVHEIVALFHKRLPMLSRVADVTPARRATINARWTELAAHRTLAFWDQYFARVARAPFLIGKKVDWKATFDWLLAPKNLAKVMAGNYDPAPDKMISDSDEAAFRLSQTAQ